MTNEELKQLIESNARSIQALADTVQSLANATSSLTEEGQKAQAERAELRQATLGIANLLSVLDEDRPTLFRRLSSIEGKVDQLLERQRDNREG